MNVQIIEKNGKPEWAVIPFQEYQKMQAAMEEAGDIAAIEKNLAALRDGSELAIPGEVTFAILDGVSPIRAWREHKRIKINELASTVGISPAYLSQIENARRNPTVDTLKAIARELGLEVEMLI